MGTPDFAAESLRALVEAGNEVVAVFTKKDTPRGRKAILTPTEVKVEAEKLAIPVFTPDSVKNEETINLIKSFNPELLVVVAYGKILPGAVLEIAPKGAVNVHASLLPKYRGAAPIQWSIINGEEKTGITTMFMDEGLDTGDMILKTETEIGENENFASLWNRLSKMGAETLVKTVELIEAGEETRIPQTGESSYSPMISHETEKIDITKSDREIHNLIRGLSPFPGAYLLLGGLKLKILESRKTEETGEKIGEITLRKNRIFLTTGNYKMLELLRLKLEGSKEMDSSAFVAGRKISNGDILL